MRLVNDWFEAIGMTGEHCRIIIAVESTPIRSRLAQALNQLDVQPERLPPDLLLQTELSGPVLVYLETGDDVDWLTRVAREVSQRWEAPGFCAIIAIASDLVLIEEVVFDFWRIGPEMRVIVHGYSVDELDQRLREAATFAPSALSATGEGRQSP